MDFEEMNGFLRQENERLLDSLPGLSEDNIALAQSVKLSEEVGELGTAVLDAHQLQRPREETTDKELAMEIADVLITAMLLGETLGVDIEQALEQKMERIDTRYE